MVSATPNHTPEQTKDFTPPSWPDILAAHARIAPKIHRTPVLTNSSLDALAGARIFFKCENFQKTGSFKIRGATNAILSLTDAEVARGIVTQSSGNHGAAIACAAAWRGAKSLGRHAQKRASRKISRRGELRRANYFMRAHRQRAQ